MQVEIRREKGDKKPVVIDFDFGASTPEAVVKFNKDGAYGDIVHYYFVRGVTDELRLFVRECWEKKLNGAALQSAVTAWRPEIKFRGAPPLEKAKKAVKSLTPEERDALLKELTEAANGS